MYISPFILINLQGFIHFNFFFYIIIFKFNGKCYKYNIYNLFFIRNVLLTY